MRTLITSSFRLLLGRAITVTIPPNHVVAPRRLPDAFVHPSYVLLQHVSAFVIHTTHVALEWTFFRMYRVDVLLQILRLVEIASAKVTKKGRISMHDHMMSESAIREVILAAQMTYS